ncbi:hypothetical protein BU187_07320, partial [Enterococcus faecium]
MLSFSIILPYLIVDLKLCNRTIRRIQKDFSCMEEMKYFIQRVEEQLYLESETSQTKVTVSHNRLDVYKRRPE